MPPQTLQDKTETASLWICPWCHLDNLRKHAGEDKCFFCGAIVFTQFTGYENEIQVKFSQAPNIRPVWLKTP